MVDKLKRQTRNEVQALFDRANAHPIYGPSGPWRYIPGKFVATTESEMLRYAPYYDNGDRPGCVCLRSDNNKAYQLTGPDRDNAISWTVLSWITISQARPAGPAAGDVWFFRAPDDDPGGPINTAGSIYQKSAGVLRWVSWLNNQFQLEKLRTAIFYPGWFIQQDCGDGNFLFLANDRAWHSSGRYIIDSGPNSSTVNIDQQSFVSLVIATDGVDPKLRLVVSQIFIPCVHPDPADGEMARSHGAFYIYDSDGSTEWLLSGTARIAVLKPDSDIPPLVQLRIEPDGFSTQMDLDFQQGEIFYYVKPVEISGLRRGRQDVYFDVSTEDGGIFSIVDEGVIQDTTLTWESTQSDLLVVPSLHPTKPILEIRALPSFKDFSFGVAWNSGYHIGQPNPGWPNANYIYYLNQGTQTLHYDVGAASDAAVIVAKVKPIREQFTTETFFLPSTNQLHICQFANGQLSNQYAFDNVLQLMGKPKPVPLPTNGVSVAIQSVNDFRGLARHSAYDGEYQRNQFGSALTLFAGKQLERTFPHTVYAIVAHRIGKREPATVSASDPGLTIAIGNKTGSGFNGFHNLTMGTGKHSCSPYFPDWVNFSNQTIHYAISTDYPAMANDEVNLEVVLHHPKPRDVWEYTDTEGNTTLSIGQRITAEMYNQMWNQLEETEVYDLFQIKQISGN